MAGFVIELVATGIEFGGALKLVDLGQCELVQSRVFGTARIAGARWQATRQLTIFETPDRRPDSGTDPLRAMRTRSGTDCHTGRCRAVLTNSIASSSAACAQSRKLSQSAGSSESSVASSSSPATGTAAGGVLSLTDCHIAF